MFVGLDVALDPVAIDLVYREGFGKWTLQQLDLGSMVDDNHQFGGCSIGAHLEAAYSPLRVVQFANSRALDLLAFTFICIDCFTLVS